jgi:isoquinoline 1-oxidoreductase subunit alpha
MITLTINGKKHQLDIDPDTPLLWVLRDELKMTGTKLGCGMAMCGACTVHMNGTPIRSCSMPVSALANANIQTIDEINTPAFKAVQQAWRDLDVVQCGYCQSGQIMSATALLQTNANPTDEQIDAAMSGNLCRCATYHRIRGAIHLASDAMAKSAKATGGNA